MNCPQRHEMLLHKAISKQYPDLFRSGKWGIDPGAHAPVTTSLIEPALDYDPDAAADLVVKNGLIHDGDDVIAKDMAVTGNVITRIGSPEKIAEVTSGDTTIIDARGAFIAPGFVDSHMHLDVAMQRLRACDVEDVETLARFRDRVLDFAREHVDRPMLTVFGLRYFDTPVIPAERCRHVLDEIIADRPLIVHAHDLHTVWANTRALEEAGVLHAMPPYPHLVEELGLEDKIVVDAEGIPTGEFREPEVCHFLTGPLQSRYTPSVEQQLDDLKAVCRNLASLGITGVHRMGLAQPAEDLSFLLLLLELEQQGELPIRVNSSISCVDDDAMLHNIILAHEAATVLRNARYKRITAEQMHDALLELLEKSGSAPHDHIMRRTGDGGPGEEHPHRDGMENTARHILRTNMGTYVKPHTDRDNPHSDEAMPDTLDYHAKVRCDTVKIFMDGVVEKDTAYRLDTPSTPGIPEFKQGDLDVLIPFADKLGLQVAAHCIGDGAVHSVLNAITQARTENAEVDTQRGHRIPHRVEHIEMCRPEDITRFGELHVITSMQPLHERPPMTLWHELVPQSAWNTAFAWQETLNEGAVLVFGSDWPIVSCDVRAGIKRATTRKPWYDGARNQAVSFTEALEAYTTGPAFSEYSRNIKGRVRPGMLADFVILAGDIRNLSHDGQECGIRHTVCDGEIVYSG